jgi:hypothetical protein
MYKILGVDGREYGPVTAEQLRQWIREGRANAQTKAQAEGTTEWKPISAFPEFADLAGGPSPSSGAPPAVGSVDADTLAAQVTSRGYEVDIGACIRRAWTLLTGNFWRLVGTSLLILVLLGGVGVALGFTVNFALGVPLVAHRGHPWEAIVAQWPGILVNILWNLVASGPLMGGLYNYYLKLMRGQPADIGDAFAGFGSAFIPLLLAHVVSGVLVGFGFLCCILPGIYLGVAWKFTLPLVIDKRMGFWEAMELSRKTVTRQWWILFALFIVAGLISALGVIACCVGVFATLPIGIAAKLYAYEDLLGSQIIEPTSHHG